MSLFVCRNGHLHREQWLADNCRRCKAAERRRLKRAEQASYRKAMREKTAAAESQRHG